MASLRDVLNHAGKKVRVHAPGLPAREGLAMRRGDVGLLEPKLAPRVGDIVEFVDEAQRLVVLEATEERHLEKTDHYRVKLGPARG